MTRSYLHSMETYSNLARGLYEIHQAPYEQRVVPKTLQLLHRKLLNKLCGLHILDTDEAGGSRRKPGNTSSNLHPQPDPLAFIATEQVRKLNSMLESLRLVPRSSNVNFIYYKGDDGEVMFIEIIQYNDEPRNKGPNEGKGGKNRKDDGWIPLLGFVWVLKGTSWILRKLLLLRFGNNKWYQSFALRNFDLEDMELESINSGPNAKLPILKLGEYEMWAIRIKQYF
ncbi:hypothetical protein Tco_1272628 [Tanacetum coccineum]